jgi:hypothetical protein
MAFELKLPNAQLGAFGGSLRGGIGLVGGFNPGGDFDVNRNWTSWINPNSTDLNPQWMGPGRIPGFFGYGSLTGDPSGWVTQDIPEYGYGDWQVIDGVGQDERLYRDYARQFNPYVQGLLQGHTSPLDLHESIDYGNPEHEALIPIEDRRGKDEEGNYTNVDPYGGQEFTLGEMNVETFANYPPLMQKMIWNHLGGKYPWEVGPDQYVGDYPGPEGPGGDTGGDTLPHWWPLGGGDDGPGGGGGGTVYPLPPPPGPPDIDPIPDDPKDEWPNIIEPTWSQLYTQPFQPNPMWGGGPASWLMGSPISNSWLGGHQIMANDPWSSLVAQQTPNAYDAYWNMVNPLTPSANSGLTWEILYNEDGTQAGGQWVPISNQNQTYWQNSTGSNYSTPQGGEQGGALGTQQVAAEPVVDQAAEPAAGGQTFLEQYGMSQEAYNTAANNFNQQMMSGFQDFMGVSPQQYSLAQDPSGWRGDQTFGERVGMSQEAYNTARNNAWQTYKQGKPVLGPGAQGGAFGTYDPTIGAQGSQGAQQAAAAPDAAAAAATPAPVTGTGQITPGALGSAGTAAQFNLAQNPNAWRGAQYGSLSPITPGTMGAGDSAVAAGSGQITPGTMGGFGTAAQFTQTQTPDNWRGTQFGSPSPITPGTLGGGQTPFFGAPSPITPGTMGGDGASQPSPITPGTMGGGGTSQPSPITPGTMGGMGAAQPSPITPGIMGGGTSQPSPITVRMGGAPQEQWNHQGMFSRQGTYPQNQIAPGSFGSMASMPGSPSPITPGRMGGGNYRGMFSMHRPNGTRPVYGSQQRKGF